MAATTALLGAAATAAVADPRPEAAVLQRDANALLDQGAPGVIAEVVTPHGSTTVRAGVGNTTTGEPIPWRAKFRIGSFTKTFVAATMLQLVGEGELSLEDPVDRWLPGLVTGNGNDGRRITVRQLLQQTSGLPEYMRLLPYLRSEQEFLANRTKTLQPEELIALALQQQPMFAPGTRWAYSSTNYILAGMIIRRVTGHSWQSEVTRRIIRPLRLTDTSVPRTALDVPEPHAIGYERFPRPDGTFGDPIDVTRINPTWADAGGSIISTTADGNRFLQALLGGRVLRPAQLAAMTTTVPAPSFSNSWPKPRYGLGLLWSSTPCGGMWSHPGDFLGYGFRNGVDRNGTRSVAVAMNTHSLVRKPGVPAPTFDPALDLIQHALCGTR
ncbi:serine hydrolase domain-containing protein [Cryptosporangium minutisporangium]|uniref:serine hydrolase domain-containing protein n=1 Tax=Cryptosporangium minutisporangium TaxID=113569 RepID=UPI0031E7E767